MHFIIQIAALLLSVTTLAQHQPHSVRLYVWASELNLRLSPPSQAQIIGNMPWETQLTIDPLNERIPADTVFVAFEYQMESFVSHEVSFRTTTAEEIVGLDAEWIQTSYQGVTGGDHCRPDASSKRTQLQTLNAKAEQYKIILPSSY